MEEKNKVHWLIRWSHSEDVVNFQLCVGLFFALLAGFMYGLAKFLFWVGFLP